MKARPANYSGFEQWLRKRTSQGGDGRKMLTKEHREESTDIYIAFEQAKSGHLGLKCACGQEGHAVITIQPCPTWPAEKHVVCKSHAELMQEVEVFFKQIINEK